jgi:hypothetical protein
MHVQTTFLLALGLLIAAALVVSASGWILLSRDRRTRRAMLAATDGVANGERSFEAKHPEVAEER